MATTAQYVNGFWAPQGLDPKVYSTDAQPEDYRGFTIYNRIKSTNPSARCFDVVKDGVCIGQYAGRSGAQGLINTICDRPCDFWAVRALEKLKINSV